MGATYIVRFNSMQADLLETNGKFVRRFTTRPGKTIVTATVNNADADTTVTINYSDGSAELYHRDGRIIRRF